VKRERLSTLDRAFMRTVMTYWRRNGRHDLPWRHTRNPYHILVSEIMLQQTQVPRVIDKYRTFLRAFPSFRALARATPARVLKAWQGLGYNRRALMLLKCAVTVAGRAGRFPDEYEALQTLPGVGPYTAGAVMAFAYDVPIPMIETNIRRVYIHHFFPRLTRVPDADILPLVARHAARVSSAREWYSALMDYGSWLTTQTVNPNTRSKHYTRQPAFEGSRRQLRGAVVRYLVEHAKALASVIARTVAKPTEDVTDILAGLEREGFVSRCAHARCVHNPHWSLR
jgi:A/G-specific adenine glycosylase